MTTTEYLANPNTDKHLAWMNGTLAKMKFNDSYANADLKVEFNRVKGETFDTFLTFTLADGTVTTFATGKSRASLNGGEMKFTKDVMKEFRALVAPAPAPAPVKDVPETKDDVATDVPKTTDVPETKDVAETKAVADAPAKPALPKTHVRKASKRSVDKMRALVEGVLGEPVNV